MKRHLGFALNLVVLASMSGILPGSASAVDIIYADLGAAAPFGDLFDVEFDGTTLSTIDDGVGATAGDQNTNVEFLNFLNFIPDIATQTASFTLDGMTTSGSPTVFGGVLVVQTFSGGSLDIYDPANVLLLSATLNNSALSGPLGPPATGAIFSTSTGLITGGTLAPLIDPNTLALSLNLSNINGSSGLSVSGLGPSLDPFESDATVTISANQIPEPSSEVLLLLGTVVGARRAIRNSWRVPRNH
jgi:hypothetical protein